MGDFLLGESGFLSQRPDPPPVIHHIQRIVELLLQETQRRLTLSEYR